MILSPLLKKTAISSDYLKSIFKGSDGAQGLMIPLQGSRTRKSPKILSPGVRNDAFIFKEAPKCPEHTL
jgi:hypothetical protein